MKTTIKIFALIVVLFTVSCKDKSEDPVPQSVPNVVPTPIVQSDKDEFKLEFIFPEPCNGDVNQKCGVSLYFNTLASWTGTVVETDSSISNNYIKCTMGDTLTKVYHISKYSKNIKLQTTCKYELQDENNVMYPCYALPSSYNDPMNPLITINVYKNGNKIYTKTEHGYVVGSGNITL